MFLLLGLFCAGAAPLGSAKMVFDPFGLLIEIPPPICLDAAPRALLPSEPAHRTGNLGRLLTAAEGCGASRSGASRIVGGSQTRPGAYPWMALIGYLSGNSITFNCGGSLITSRHVLTAAHCVNSALYMVRLGEHNTNSHHDPNCDDVRIDRVYSHPSYDAGLLTHDISIFYLSCDVIKPICVPRQSLVNHNPFVAGWGYIAENSQQSAVLLHAQVPIISNQECAQLYAAQGAYKSPTQFGQNVVCAGHRFGGQDACQGDSGGPLMLPMRDGNHFPFYQVGVVSYGIGCARAYSPGVYTNVAHYAGWIQQNLY